MQEENSSSQRDKVTIISVKKKRSAGIEGFVLKLSEGTSFFLISDVYYRNSVFEGESVSLEKIEALREESEYLLAERKAFDLLSRGMHTRKQLKDKLLKRKFESVVVDRTLKRMEELGYLDDAEYAKTWVEMRKERHPEGRSAMISGLIKRGVKHETAENIVKELFSEEDEWEAANKVYDNFLKTNKPNEEKLYRYLTNRGFSYSIVGKLLERYRRESYNEF